MREPPPKAEWHDYPARMREIIADPHNLLIKRTTNAGVETNGCVELHNGNQVPLRGQGAYYDEDFSKILVLNRGVHEPLEEYVFQQVLRRIRRSKHTSPVMIELGAYWAHYSMWFQKELSGAQNFMVEPDQLLLKVGESNFLRNGYVGHFVHGSIGKNGLSIDALISNSGIQEVAILHSDIQGSELFLTQTARTSLEKHKIKWIFVSTHSEEIHGRVSRDLRQLGYRVHVDSGFDKHTSSYDGLLVAGVPREDLLFGDTSLIGREELTRISPDELLNYLVKLLDVSA